MNTPVPSTLTFDHALVESLTMLVARAGAAIMALAPHELAVRTKADASPVTAADEAADTIIAAGLAKLLPRLPVVCEEQAATHAAAPQGPFVLIDPLDGTREFINGRDEFTVNLAILDGGYPIAGFIAAPALGLVYRGLVGRGAERLSVAGNAATPQFGRPSTIRTRAAPAGALVAAVSRSHADAATMALIARLPVAERLVIGSSLKFCRVAEGLVDVYPRLGRTHEWDVAAGHALVVAAGGVMTAASGAPLHYGRAGFVLDDFIAWGDAEVARALC